MGRHSVDKELTKLNLEHVIRWDLVYFSYANVDQKWSGMAHPEQRTTRLVHFVKSGAAHLTVEGKRFDLKVGHFYLIPSDIETERFCQDQYGHYYGYFHCRNLAGQHLLTNHSYPLDLGTWDVNSLGETSERLNSVSTLLYIKFLVLGALIQRYPGLADKLNKVKPAGPKFEQCLRYIDANLSAELEVRQLAEVVGMSRNAFTRAFKNATGTTPRAYLNGEINEKACRLVVGTGMSIREIGDKLGFRDEYYFNRFFKKMNGLPPLRFRKSLG